MAYGLPSSSTIERNVRKNNARALRDLGFESSEIARILGFSLNTINNYLKETQGIHCSGLFDFAFNPEVFPNFTLDEQNLLNKTKGAQDNAEHLSREFKRTNKIAKGQGLIGWLHKKFFKDTEDYKIKNEKISKQIDDLVKITKPLIIQFKEPKKSPHLSKSVLEMSINFIKKEG